MATIRLEHVGIVVPPATKDATVAFYQSAFGWHILREMTGVAFAGDGSGGRIEFLFMDGSPMTPPNHLAFVVPLAEFDDLMAKIKAAGVPTDEKANDTPAGDRLFWFFDPAGNRVQIVGRATAMPE